MRTDNSGEFWLTFAVVATSAIVGGLMGAISAAATGGNVLESAIEGTLTGIVGAALGLSTLNPVLAIGIAIFAGSSIDFATQATTHYIEKGRFDLSEIDYGRVVKTGVQTGISTCIPKFGKGAENAVDAFATALIWAEGATLLSIADIIVTNIIDASRTPKRNFPKENQVVGVR